MKSDSHADLLRAMPGLQQEHLAALTDELARDLAVLLAESRENQKQALHTAIEKGMRHVPMLLRGPLKKILFP